MFFEQLFDEDTSTYTYVVADEVTKEAAIVDPVRAHVSAIYLPLLKRHGFRLQYVMETHVHADHVTGAAPLRDATGARTVVHVDSAARCADVRVADGALLCVGSIPIRVLHTPGHTPCHVAYLVNHDRVLTGDSLLIGGCGRTDFQQGDAGTLYDAITRQLFSLPGATLVFPGHDYRGQLSSTIGRERATNPRLAGKSRSAFIAVMRDLGLPPPKHIMEAVPANERCGEAAAEVAAP